MKFLITGGAGFIGSHLARRLAEDGHSVSILDDLSTGSLHNIRFLLKSGKVSFTKGSILDQNVLRALMRKTDAVFHLAAAVGVKVVMEKPLNSFFTNIDGTKNILDLAHDYRLPVLVASTSEVYGKLEHVPYKEDGDRLYGSIYNVRWGYALSKSVDEFLALLYAQEKGLKAVIVRFFNTVGPGQTGRYGMVIPRFVKSALRQESIPVYGNGRQVRCFCHVSDTVTAISKLILNKKAYGEIFNVGSTQPITILNLAKKIKRMTLSRSKIVHVSQSVMMAQTGDEMRIRIPDISKIRRLIGWKPIKTLDDILKDTIQTISQN
jgi:UDP-glucose 4-epimerase